MSFTLTEAVWAARTGLPLPKKTVLSRLADRANDFAQPARPGIPALREHECYVGVRSLAFECEISKSSAVRAVQELERMGFVEVRLRGIGTRASVYRVCPERLAVHSEGPLQESLAVHSEGPLARDLAVHPDAAAVQIGTLAVHPGAVAVHSDGPKPEPLNQEKPNTPAAPVCSPSAEEQRPEDPKPSHATYREVMRAAINEANFRRLRTDGEIVELFKCECAKRGHFYTTAIALSHLDQLKAIARKKLPRPQPGRGLAGRCEADTRTAAAS